VKKKKTVQGHCILRSHWTTTTKKSRWRQDFPHPSRPALGPTPPPIQRLPCLSCG